MVGTLVCRVHCTWWDGHEDLTSPTSPDLCLLAVHCQSLRWERYSHCHLHVGTGKCLCTDSGDPPRCSALQCRKRQDMHRCNPSHYPLTFCSYHKGTYVAAITDHYTSHALASAASVSSQLSVVKWYSSGPHCAGIHNMQGLMPFLALIQTYAALLHSHTIHCCR